MPWGPISLMGGSLVGIGWAGVLSTRFLAFRLSNWHDANTAIRIGADANCPLLDLLPDEFLDLRQVSVGFKVTPVSILARASHRSVQSLAGKSCVHLNLRLDGFNWHGTLFQVPGRCFSET